MPLIEAVPNFSLGPNHPALKQISRTLSLDSRVCLLHQDSGLDANRTVFTLVGEPKPLLERIVAAVELALSLVDFETHQGNHPKVGVLDVCPLIPLCEISLGETIGYSKQLGATLARQFGLPVFFYQQSASTEKNRELSFIRQGGLEALGKRIQQGEMTPDLGPQQIDPHKGVSVVGVRSLMVAYNINLQSATLEQAKALAAQLRALRGSDSRLAAVRFLGWYLEEHQTAQISTNVMDLKALRVGQLFRQVTTEAQKMGLEVSGSELVGMCPLAALVDLSARDPQEQAKIQVQQLGLDAFGPFCLDDKVIELALIKQGHLSEARSLLGDQVSLDSLI